MTLRVTPFEYDQIMYNEAIEYQENDWNRGLNDHERNLLIRGYRIGRTVEMLNQWIKEGNGEQQPQPQQPQPSGQIVDDDLNGVKTLTVYLKPQPVNDPNLKVYLKPQPVNDLNLKVYAENQWTKEEN